MAGLQQTLKSAGFITSELAVSQEHTHTQFHTYAYACVHTHLNACLRHKEPNWKHHTLTTVSKLRDVSKYKYHAMKVKRRVEV